MKSTNATMSNLAAQQSGLMPQSKQATMGSLSSPLPHPLPTSPSSHPLTPLSNSSVAKTTVLRTRLAGLTAHFKSQALSKSHSQASNMATASHSTQELLARIQQLENAFAEEKEMVVELQRIIAGLGKLLDKNDREMKEVTAIRLEEFEERGRMREEISRLNALLVEITEKNKRPTSFGSENSEHSNSGSSGYEDEDSEEDRRELAIRRRELVREESDLSVLRRFNSQISLREEMVGSRSLTTIAEEDEEDLEVLPDVPTSSTTAIQTTVNEATQSSVRGVEVERFPTLPQTHFRRRSSSSTLRISLATIDEEEEEGNGSGKFHAAVFSNGVLEEIIGGPDNFEMVDVMAVRKLEENENGMGWKVRALGAVKRVAGNLFMDRKVTGL